MCILGSHVRDLLFAPLVLAGLASAAACSADDPVAVDEPDSTTDPVLGAEEAPSRLST